MKKNLKFIVEVLSFFLIGVPIAVCLYLFNEIYHLGKKLIK